MESHFQDAEIFWETDETKIDRNPFCKLPSTKAGDMQKELEKEKVTSKNVSSRKKEKKRFSVHRAKRWRRMNKLSTAIQQYFEVLKEQ